MTMEESLQNMIEAMSAPDGWEIASVVVDIGSVVAAVVALYISIRSIKAQNKQSLFEKRVAIYMQCKVYHEAYNRCRDHFARMQASTAPLSYLIELYVLCDFHNLGLRITKFPKQDKYEMRSVYLAALQSIQSLKEKCRLLFKNDVAKDVRHFLGIYEKLITCLYKYQEIQAKLSSDFKDTEEWQELIQILNDMEDFTKKIDIDQSLVRLRKEIKL